jgi:acyl-coenzyme A thioesterase PaaI-like protein
LNEKPASLQEQYAAASICFGCGPANKDGLHIRSYPQDDTLICDWTPEAKYQAFPGALYGGLIGSLLDCHCNWTASWHLMHKNGLDTPPCTVTAEYTVKFMRPTPSDQPLKLVARVVQSKERSATVEGELFSGGELCATCHAVFVAVKPGHPAYHRW